MSPTLHAQTPTERMAVAFARVLRGAGLRIPMGSVLTFVDALGRPIFTMEMSEKMRQLIPNRL